MRYSKLKWKRVAVRCVPQIIAAMMLVWLVGYLWGHAMSWTLRIAQSDISLDNKYLLVSVVGFAPIVAIFPLFPVLFSWRSILWYSYFRFRFGKFVSRQAARLEGLQKSGVSLPVALATIQGDALAEYRAAIFRAGRVSGDREVSAYRNYVWQLGVRIRAQVRDDDIPALDRQSALVAAYKYFRLEKVALRIEGRELFGRR